MGGAWPRVERSRNGSLLADIRAELGQIQLCGCSWLFVVVHGSFTGGDQKSGVGAGGAAASELGVGGASGSGGASGGGGAWGSGQTALVRSGDAEE